MSCETFVALNHPVSFKSVFTDARKVETWSSITKPCCRNNCFCFGWPLKILEKNYWHNLLLKAFFVFSSSNYSTRFCFLWKKRLNRLPILLLSVIFLSLRLAKYFFFFFLNRYTHQFLCCLWEYLFASVGLFKSLFPNVFRNIITLNKILFMNCLLFSQIYFILRGARWIKTFVHII